MIEGLILAVAQSPDSKLQSPNIGDEIDELMNVLSNALLAACLLGRFQVAEFEVRSAEFAEGDEPPQEKTPNSKRRTEKPSVGPRFDLPPAEAIDYFKAKKILRKKEFNQLSKEAQQGAFTISGVYRDDVLAGFKSEIDSALREGRTQQETIKRFKSILGGASHEQLGEFHLETVFRVNMQTAYGVGRRRGMDAVTDDFPFWTYHTVGDDRVRPRHRSLEGMTLRYDNPFWSTHYPPWAFNCRCGVTPADGLPEGYDPAHPSGDDETTLFYDEQGMPEAVELGPMFLDLKVGNFSGIPPGATLQSAIEAGVDRAKEGRK
jgi:SPP1 gp7 family putative phage head morphogenesis protein